MSKTKENLSHWQEQPKEDGPARHAAAEFIPSGFADFTFFEDRTVDKLMQVVIAMGAEHWVLRRRMLVMEALLDKGQVVSTRQIEEYVPTEEQTAVWEKERDIYIKRAFEALTTEGSPVGSARAKTDRK